MGRPERGSARETACAARTAFPRAAHTPVRRDGSAARPCARSCVHCERGRCKKARHRHVPPSRAVLARELLWSLHEDGKTQGTASANRRVPSNSRHQSGYRITGEVSDMLTTATRGDVNRPWHPGASAARPVSPRMATGANSDPRATNPAMARLLGCRFGDRLVYTQGEEDRRLLGEAQVLGLVSPEGYLTPHGYRFWQVYQG
jgi:hypothetical protein